MWGRYPPSLTPLELLIAEKTGITGYEFNFVHAQDRRRPVTVTLEITKRPDDEATTPCTLTIVYSDKYECVGDASDVELREEYGRLEQIAVDRVVSDLKDKPPGVVFIELEQMAPPRIVAINNLREQLRASRPQLGDHPVSDGIEKALLDVYDSLNRLEQAVVGAQAASTGDWDGLEWL